MTREKDELHQLFDADANDCCARDGSVFAAVCYIEPKSNSAQYSSDGQTVFFAATKNGTVHAYLFDLPSVVLATTEAWRTTSASIGRIGATPSLEDIARVVMGLRTSDSNELEDRPLPDARPTPPLFSLIVLF